MTTITQDPAVRPPAFAGADADGLPAPDGMPVATAEAKAAMAGAVIDDDRPAGFVLDIKSILELLGDDEALDEWFLRFTADNDDLGYDFEIDLEGNLIAMASESFGGWIGAGNLYYDARTWSDAGPGGLVLPGNALVRIGDGGRRAPDAGWIAPEQLIEELLPPDWLHHGVPFAPRFVAEIRSISNSLESQQAKMEEWIANGVALGWLIDPILRQVHIYRPGLDPEILDDPETVGGGEVLPGFVFEVRRQIFEL